MSNFDPNAILRGAQLTLVGANRAMQNPNLFKHQLYRQAAIAVLLGIMIQLIVSIPVYLAKVTLWFIDIFSDLEASTWDDKVVDALHFLQHSVLQVPFFLMSLMKFITPAFDEMFMESLDWVDRTYVAKHQSDSPEGLRAMYYPNLKQYKHETHKKEKTAKANAIEGINSFIFRYGKKAAFSLMVYLLTFVPYVGSLVLPAVSFWYFHNAVGTKPAVAIFATGLVLPKRFIIRFLQTYFSSRSLMRELLVPYFKRVPFDSKQKRAWFFDREGVLFGFGVAWFIMIKIPLVGVLVYGIAEASTAYLITKITDPPPPPVQAQSYVDSQIRWKNKTKFLSMPLANLDATNVVTTPQNQDPATVEMPTKKFS